MTYVEWLRVRSAIVAAAIVFAALLVLTAISRFALGAAIGSGPIVFGGDAGIVEHSRANGADVTTTGIPSKHERIVVTRRGGGQTVRIIVPGAAPLTVHTQRTQTLPVPAGVDVGMLFAFAMIVGFVMATILGAPLARENGGHLEIAWTKPISRTAYALRLFGTDVLGILAVQALSVLTELAGIFLYLKPHWVAEPGIGGIIALSVLAPLAWYAMYYCITASLKRGGNTGTFLGLAWPIALFLLPFAQIGNDPGASAGMKVVHWFFYVLNLLNPLGYAGIGGGHTDFDAGPHRVSPLYGFSLHYGLLALAALTIVYVAAGCAQWKRLEA